MYRRVLLSALSGVALFSPAFAADIYSPAPPPYAAVAFPPSWAGFYIGVNGGFGGETAIGFRDTVIDQTTVPSTSVSDITGKTTIAGGFGGGQLGYNFQWGPLVAGLETDIEGSNIMGSGANASFNPTVSPTVGCGVTATGGLAGVCGAKNDLNVDWFGTVRGRLGYAWGGTLLYVTGGFAYGGVNASTSWADNFTGAGPGVVRSRASTSETRTGWAAGGGIETKLAPNWTLRGEYQFVDLGAVSTGAEPLLTPAGVSSCAPGSGTDCFTLRGRSETVGFNTVRIGVNYLFAAEPLPLK